MGIFKFFKPKIDVKNIIKNLSYNDYQLLIDLRNLFGQTKVEKIKFYFFGLISIKYNKSKYNGFCSLLYSEYFYYHISDKKHIQYRLLLSKIKEFGKIKTLFFFDKFDYDSRMDFLNQLINGYGNS